MAPIPTKASLMLANSDEPQEEVAFEVVVHEKRQRKVKTIVPESAKIPDQPQEFDIKRARHDVIRFGATGLGVKEKKNAQIALAVKLGAKPPKGAPKSLKDHLQERAAAAAQLKDSQASGIQVKPVRNFHANQLISTAQRRKSKRTDAQNTIRDYGTVKVAKKSRK